MLFRLFLISTFLLLSFASQVSYSATTQGRPENMIVITNSKAWKPFSYMQGGKPKGLLIDFWRLYGERTGTKVVFKLVDWQVSLDNLSHGEAQVHAGLVYSEKRAKLFDFGSKLMNVQASIYIEKDMLSIVDTNLNGLKLPVGVVQGGDEYDYAMTHYPHLNLITYTNNELMFEAVKAQEISSFIADKQVANFYMLSFLRREGEFVSLKKLYDKPIQFAVRKGDTALLNLIEDQFSKFSRGDIDQIKQKWINTETKLPDGFYNRLVLMLLLIALAYIFSLRKAVAKRTLQLAVANKNLTKQVNSDVLTGLYNRRFLMNYLGEVQQKGYQNGIAILMIDIDFFKPINDTYGHPVGDIALTILAKRVQYCIRETDILALRWRGVLYCFKGFIDGKYACDW
ncbi:MAG: sensor domain-containing diguanylate cyclase [Psychromonas sp.]|nr:sensor domain-containing diguanylate cyclase [Alteromonadales bacterium]MCP5079921.1 sensor domain-containing diguanylate cyclase [Psychromonas sp.]